MAGGSDCIAGRPWCPPTAARPPRPRARHRSASLDAQAETQTDSGAQHEHGMDMEHSTPCDAAWSAWASTLTPSNRRDCGPRSPTGIQRATACCDASRGPDQPAVGSDGEDSEADAARAAVGDGLLLAARCARDSVALHRAALAQAGAASLVATHSAVAGTSGDGPRAVRVAEDSDSLHAELGHLAMSQLPGLLLPRQRFAAEDSPAAAGSLSSAGMSSAQLALALRLAVPAQSVPFVCRNRPRPAARRSSSHKASVAGPPPLGLGPGSGLLATKVVDADGAVSEV